MLSNCGVGEDSWGSLRQQGDHHSVLKEINHENSLKRLMLKLKLQYFDLLMQRADSHWKRPWCWERETAGGEGDGRGQDGWMASLTQWTWVWASSWRWWRPGKPSVLQSMGSQIVRRDRATEQQQIAYLSSPHTRARARTHTHTHTHTGGWKFISITRILQSSLRFLLSNYQEMQYFLLETSIPPQISLEARCQIEL